MNRERLQFILLFCLAMSLALAMVYLVVWKFNYLFN